MCFFGENCCCRWSPCFFVHYIQIDLCGENCCCLWFPCCLVHYIQIDLFGENCCCRWSPCCFVHYTDWFGLITSGETTSWRTSVWSTVCWDWLVYHFFIDQNTECSCIFYWDTFFNNSIYIHFTWGISQVLLSNIFSLPFRQTFLLISSNSLFFDPWTFCHLLTCFRDLGCLFCFS